MRYKVNNQTRSWLKIPLTTNSPFCERLQIITQFEEENSSLKFSSSSTVHYHLAFLYDIRKKRLLSKNQIGLLECL